MNSRSRARFWQVSPHAFTRLELLACICALAVLAASLLPLLASNTSRSQLAQCFSNLRQIGRAQHEFAAERGNFSFLTPSEEGGSFDTPVPAAFIAFAALSNQLTTAAVLACPADVRKVARDFGMSAEGGLLHANFRSQAISYFIGLHATLNDVHEPLGGDRNLRFSRSSTCPFLPRGQAQGLMPQDPSAGWTNSMHGLFGNVLRADGSVETTTSSALKETIARGLPNRSDEAHFLTP
jgi:type II secretory pathway pseudopilin PulG